MKTILFFTTLITGVSVLQAQSLEQGNQQLYYHRYQTAENTFHQFLKQDPNNASAWYDLTKAYLLQDQLDKASDTIQYAPAAAKSDPWYKVAYGDILLHQGKTQEAGNYFNEALDDTREKNADILGAIAQSEINAKQGDANYAIELLNKAIKRDKKNPSLYTLLGDAYMKMRNGSEAFKAYQSAIDKDDKYAAAYYKMGEIFLTQKTPGMYVDYFKKSVAADPDYAPALYKLYVYEFNRDAAKAMDYYNDYMAKSDASIQNQYDLTDLFYLNKQYDQAIQKANAIVSKEGDKVQPRLYKLISYSYAAQKDSTKAFDYMQKYFDKEADSNMVAKDYLLMGELYASSAQGQDSLALVYFNKAANKETDSAELVKYYQRFANLAANDKDFNEQAKWLGKYYLSNDQATNLDLFNWGLAAFKAEDYVTADTVFGRYVAKYPEQTFGYYWRAKSKALADTNMAQGLAVPAYQNLIAVLEKNPNDPNYKNWMVESYAYLAAYETNTEKNYGEAVNYFEKVLEVDPQNESAKKYIAILEKNLDDKGSK